MTRWPATQRCPYQEVKTVRQSGRAFRELNPARAVKVSCLSVDVDAVAPVVFAWV